MGGRWRWLAEMAPTSFQIEWKEADKGSLTGATMLTWVVHLATSSDEVKFVASD